MLYCEHDGHRRSIDSRFLLTHGTRQVALQLLCHAHAKAQTPLKCMQAPTNQAPALPPRTYTSPPDPRHELRKPAGRRHFTSAMTMPCRARLAAKQRAVAEAGWRTAARLSLSRSALRASISACTSAAAAVPRLGSAVRSARAERSSALVAQLSTDGMSSQRSRALMRAAFASFCRTFSERGSALGASACAAPITQRTTATRRTAYNGHATACVGSAAPVGRDCRGQRQRRTPATT